MRRRWCAVMMALHLGGGIAWAAAGGVWVVNGVPQGGGAGPGAGGSVALESPAAGEARGLTSTFIAHEAQAFGDLCGMWTNGRMRLADATTIAGAVVVGMCADASIEQDQAGRYLLYGLARDDGWSWTPGALLYLATNGVSGSTIVTVPSTNTDECVVVVGVALSTNAMVFRPSQQAIIELN